MTRLQQSLVTLRIWGDALVPAEVTALLGGEPSLANAKGETLASVPGDPVRLAQTGSWHLRAPDCEPEDIDGQVRELLGRLSSDLGAWRRLRERFRVDLFCGLFMVHGNEGLVLAPPTLVALGVRGIELSLDIYAPHAEAPAVEAPALPAASTPRRRRTPAEAGTDDLLAGLDDGDRSGA